MFYAIASDTKISNATMQVTTLWLKQPICFYSVKPVYIWVFLIAWLKYGMEQWNGKWDGTENVHSCS